MKKYLLFYHTLRYLKPRQIVYQLWRRLNINFLCSSKIHIKYNSIEWNFPFVDSRSTFEVNGRFNFLNKSKAFPVNIDWNFAEYGKLWNYHLQYMDYLLDERVSVEERKKILLDISGQIIKKNLKPEAYPISLRLINTLIFIQKHSIQHEEINKAIEIQLSYLECNPDFHLLANHLLENYIALCFAFVAQKDKRKQEKYLKLLNQELQEQILDDGAHYERTPAYHAQILIHLLHLVYLIEVTDPLHIRLHELKKYCAKMLGWYYTMTLKGTQLPLFNDSATSTTPSYLAMQELANACSIKPEIVALGKSGFRIISINDLTLIVNCGNISPAYQPGHAHADMLHFVLYYKGEAILVDTGISTYEKSGDRLLEKSTRMHNTISIAEENQSQLWSAFRMAKRARVKILEESKEKLVAQVVWHNGIVHKRAFLFSDNNMIIKDSLNNNSILGELPMANFHFDYSLNDKLETIEDSIKIYNGLKFQFINCNYSMRESYLQAEDFNKLNQATKISAYFTGYLKTVITWNP